MEHSLYDLLAEPAPAGEAVGETQITRRKETLDNDTEAFDFEYSSSLDPGFRALAVRTAG
jgi:hypothetical protein